MKPLILSRYALNSTPTVHWPIGMMISVFTNDLRDFGSIPGRVMPKTQKMVLDASLLNT